MGSDRSFTTGICLLEPWVTAADPHVGPKLEPDPVARWEAAGASPCSLSLACSQPRSGGKEGTHPDVWVPCDLVADAEGKGLRYAKLPIGVLVGEVSGSSGGALDFCLAESQPAPWVHSPCSPIQPVSQSMSRLFPETRGAEYWKILQAWVGRGHRNDTGISSSNLEEPPQSSQGKQERHTGKVQQQLVLASKTRCMGRDVLLGGTYSVLPMSRAGVTSWPWWMGLVGEPALTQHLCLCFISCFIWEERNSVSFQIPTRVHSVWGHSFHFLVPSGCLWRSHGTVQVICRE